MDECWLNIGKVWGGYGLRGYFWGLGVIQDLIQYYCQLGYEDEVVVFGG